MARLIESGIDGKFKVLNHRGKILGEGETLKEAVASARNVTDEIIYVDEKYLGVD